MRLTKSLARSVLGLVVLSSLAVVASACRSDAEDVEGAEGEVNRGSNVVKPLGGGRVEIRRSALSEPWVWRTAITTADAALKARDLAYEFEDYQKVVPFVAKVGLLREEGDGTWTLRSLTGVGLDDPTIARFKAEERKDSIVIDLDAGFSELAGDVSVYEAGSKKLPKLRIKSSTIAGGTLTKEGDAVFLRRVVDLDVPKQPAVPEAVERAFARYAHVRLDHAFHPYKHAAGFVPRQNNEVGSFYVNPPVNDASNGPTSYAHRHDENQPIVFAFPADTPKERAEDMETAARYWNQIFDKVGLSTRVKLKKLSQGTDPFLTNEHTIEFRTIFAEGATGRGINQTDPLTGRILKSNIHVSSVFTDAAANELRIRWARIQLESGKEPSAPPADRVARAVSDYYLDTFAHEIGHTLGLRHNFAGNLASPIDGPTWSKKLDTYVTNDVDADAVLTSSIMEYLPTAYATVLGAHIRKKHAPFTYDVAAVKEIYAAKKVTAQERGPFCEKEEEPTHADCQQNDMGPKVLTDFTLTQTIADEAVKLALAAKAGQPLVVKLRLDPSAPERELRALIIGSATTQLLSAFRPGAKFVSGGEPTQQQREALAALTGDVGTAIRHIVETRTASDADVKAISGVLRTKLTTYLAAARVAVAPATVDAYVAAFEADFAETVRSALAPTR